MNKQESDIMKILLQTPFINQRMLAEASGHSLGVVNRSVKELVAQGYLDEQLWPTSRAKERISGAISEKSDNPGSRFRDADGSHQHGGAERTVGSQQRTSDRAADPPAS